jgi:hypothetical protein
MRGGRLHRYLLQSAVTHFSHWGLTSQWEVWVCGHGFAGFADLTVLTPRGLLVVEAELSARRIGGDLTKAQLLHATYLWILVPNAAVRRAVHRALERIADDAISQKCVLTLGQVPAQLTKCFPLISTSNGLSASGKQIISPTADARSRND